MKKLVCLFLLLFGFEVWADNSDFPKYVCNEYNKSTQQLLAKTVVLNPIGSTQELLDDEGNFAGTTTPFSIQIFSGANDLPSLEAQGLVTSEDVYFNFVSDDGTIEFFMYLDEMSESALTLKNGEKVIYSPHYICR